MIDPKELEFFKKEYSDFEEEEIIEILEALGIEIGDDEDRFGEYMDKDKPKATGLAKVLKKIIDQDD